VFISKDAPSSSPAPATIHEVVQGRVETILAQTQEREAVEQGAELTQACGFRFLSLAEALAAPAPPAWLIRDYLERDTLAVLFGEPGSMKSFLALDMGLCIASGQPWHGTKVSRGPVCYIAGEGFRGLLKRIQAWCRHWHLSPESLPFAVSRESVQFLDQASADAVTAAVEKMASEHGTPSLVIVDTLSRCMGGDENATADMTAFVAALDRLRARFNCSVLVVHHSGLADKTRFRGSTALHGACDWEYSLSKDGETRKLHCTKAKDFDAPPDMHFEPEQVGTGWTDPETGQEITSCVLRNVDAPAKPEKPMKLSTRNRIALDALAKVCAGDGKAHIDLWRQEAYRAGVSPSAAQDSKRKAFKRAVEELRDLGRVDCSDDHYWPMPGQAGQMPDMSRRSGGDHRPDIPDTPSKEGVRLVRSGVRVQGATA
jgi:hypothetical protein